MNGGRTSLLRAFSALARDVSAQVGDAPAAEMVEATDELDSAVEEVSPSETVRIGWYAGRTMGEALLALAEHQRDRLADLQRSLGLVPPS